MWRMEMAECPVMLGTQQDKLLDGYRRNSEPKFCLVISHSFCWMDIALVIDQKVMPDPQGSCYGRAMLDQGQ